MGDDIDRDRQKFEDMVSEYNSQTRRSIAERVAELERFKENKRVQLSLREKRAKEELGAASSEMQEEHRQILNDLEDQIANEQQIAEDKRAAWESEQRLFFDQKEKLKLQVVIDRKMAATDNILRLKKDVSDRTKQQEQEWQNM